MCNETDFTLVAATLAVVSCVAVVFLLLYCQAARDVKQLLADRNLPVPKALKSTVAPTNTIQVHQTLSSAHDPGAQLPPTADSQMKSNLHIGDANKFFTSHTFGSHLLPKTHVHDHRSLVTIPNDDIFMLPTSQVPEGHLQPSSRWLPPYQIVDGREPVACSPPSRRRHLASTKLLMYQTFPMRRVPENTYDEMYLNDLPPPPKSFKVWEDAVKRVSGGEAAARVGCVTLASQTCPPPHLRTNNPHLHGHSSNSCLTLMPQVLPDPTTGPTSLDTINDMYKSAGP
ncbi:uncharacterized protein [Procambarus clarkii]|uniref:uncharacterized protein isoform X1 n=1 Tax=Procambarus clarkii TaxID=6728 RepID=UPI0037448E43